MEQIIYRKLQDTCEMSRIKADAIMFYFVYADIVMLAKSNDLDKSVYDMKQHYLELQNFLQAIQEDPKKAFNKSCKVFLSEERLYGLNDHLNHRIRSKNVPIFARLFELDEWNTSLVCPLIADGAKAMEEKLADYAKAHLPGGKYWNPNPAVEAILKDLKPNNDVCESILGLNDYLTTTIPNMHQMTRSNLTQVKKNNTIEWYKALSPCSKQALTQLAIKNKRTVFKAASYRRNKKERKKTKGNEAKLHKKNSN